MSEKRTIQNVMVTGATGFVGRHVVRRLLAKGYTPVCLVRSAERLVAQHAGIGAGRLVPVVGSLGDRKALQNAVDLSQAAIHLVGIIINRRLKGRTFRRIHTQGTRDVVDAIRRANVGRYIHMSALGTRPDAKTAYHRTKWAAEEYVRQSGFDWTIFRPSLIHGADGEFMRLVKAFVCGIVPPVIPYFGSGQAKLQPVSVQDVAQCFVEALTRGDSVGEVFPMGGPKDYTWLELYDVCRQHLPGAKPWKKAVSSPVPVAKAMAVLSAPPMALAELLWPSIGMFRFDIGQVQMSQEDNVCDHTLVEQAFDIKMRSFEEELATYADQIG